MSKKTIRVTHAPTGTVLAEGPLGWGTTPFEGNLYIRNKYLKTDAIKPNFIPGLCVYKFIYVWMDLRLPGGALSRNLGWKYVLPNPLFPLYLVSNGPTWEAPGVAYRKVRRLTHYS